MTQAKFNITCFRANSSAGRAGKSVWDTSKPGTKASWHREELLSPLVKCLLLHKKGTTIWAAEWLGQGQVWVELNILSLSIAPRSGGAVRGRKQWVGRGELSIGCRPFPERSPWVCRFLSAAEHDSFLFCPSCPHLWGPWSYVWTPRRKFWWGLAQ